MAFDGILKTISSPPVNTGFTGRNIIWLLLLIEEIVIRLLNICVGQEITDDAAIEY